MREKLGGGTIELGEPNGEVVIGEWKTAEEIGGRHGKKGIFMGLKLKGLGMHQEG